MKKLARIYDYIISLIREESFTYKFNWYVIVIALFSLLIFLYMDKGDGNVFARAGAILILSAVIVEYTLSNIQPYEKSTNVFAGNKKIMLEKEISDIHKTQRLLAHFFIFVGTFIWAFADWLPVSFFNLLD